MSDTHVSRVGPWIVTETRNKTGHLIEVHIKAAANADPADVALGIPVDLRRGIPRQITAVAHPEDERLLEIAANVIKSEYGIIKNPGKRGRSPEFIASAAFMYVIICGKGYQNPLQIIAKMTGAPGRHTVENWIESARNRGFLTEPSGTFPGGELSEEALKLL